MKAAVPASGFLLFRTSIRLSTLRTSTQLSLYGPDLVDFRHVSVMSKTSSLYWVISFSFTPPMKAIHSGVVKEIMPACGFLLSRTSIVPQTRRTSTQSLPSALRLLLRQVSVISKTSPLSTRLVGYRKGTGINHQKITGSHPTRPTRSSKCARLCPCLFAHERTVIRSGTILNFQTSRSMEFSRIESCRRVPAAWRLSLTACCASSLAVGCRRVKSLSQLRFVRYVRFVGVKTWCFQREVGNPESSSQDLQVCAMPDRLRNGLDLSMEWWTLPLPFQLPYPGNDQTQSNTATHYR